MKFPPYLVYFGGALKVNLCKCTEYTNKIHSKRLNQPRDEPYSICYGMYLAPALCNSKVKEL